jgi:hypothetical protein
VERLARAFELDEEEPISPRRRTQREPALGDDEIDDRRHLTSRSTLS